MRTCKQFLALSVMFSLIVFSACNKDKEKDKEVKTKVELTGAQEVPVKTTPAKGTADVSYNKTTRLLTYTINWSALTGMPTGSHIHGPVPRGVNAPIKHDFFALFPKTTSGTFTNAVMVDGVALKEDSLLKGFYYFNIHTPMNPGGEIRGQIEF
ncbi:MAG: CHRD domain-containing protein [Chitinophagaceae bacterium]